MMFAMSIFIITDNIPLAEQDSARLLPRVAGFAWDGRDIPPRGIGMNVI
jgi:hypothetical protein